MDQSSYLLYPFLQAVRGNWRNSLFLKCGQGCCPYGRVTLCEGFLMAAAADGVPILMPVRYFRMLTGEPVEPEECRGVLTRQAFEAVYSLYMEWHNPSSRECQLRQLCQPPGRRDSLIDSSLL